MISGDATEIGAGGPGKAWTSNENIEATTPQAKIEVIFDIGLISFFGRRLLRVDSRTPAYL
jgi:hypothetical protein